MNAKQSFYNIINENFEEKKDLIAVYFLGNKITFKDFFAEIDKVASYLSDLGIKKGDVITINLPNIPSAFTAFYAVSKLGCIANMVHPLVPNVALCEIMKNTNSKIVFTFDLKFQKNYPLLHENKIKCIVCSAANHLKPLKGRMFNLLNRKKLNFKNFDYINYKTIQDYPCKDIEPDNSFDTPAVYLHSGGTTGEPKTIVLSAFAINSNTLYITYMLEDNPKGKGALAILPMFHGFGLSICVNGPLIYGATVVAVPSFSSKTVVSLMKKTNISYIIGVSAIFEALISNPKFVNRATKNIRRCFCGGESMPLNLKERFDKVMEKGGSEARLQEGYGLTEMTTVTSVNLKDTNRVGSVGKPLPNLSAIVIDESGKMVNDGEICFAGNTQMLSYLNDKKTTNEVFFDYDNKRFVKTGDYGYIDKDGYIYIKQRIKRIAKVNGMAVFPLEIERFAEELDFVLNACAVAVPDKRYGEVIKLFIILKDKKYDRELATEQLIKYLKVRLIKYAMPKEILFKESFPKTNVGKIDFEKLVAELGKS